MRVLVLVHEELIPPETIEGLTDKEMAPWKTEYDVVVTLEELGHETRPVGVAGDLDILGQAIAEWQPHVVFNLLEEFHGLGTNVPYVLGYLELLRQAYTGCNPVGLMLAYNKALTKSILRSHRILVPPFARLVRGRRIHKPRRLNYPMIVKSDTEHGSVGITQASVVYDDDKLKERVEHVFEKLQTDVIVEEYIDGRELYVGVLGNRRLQTFPVWELLFEKIPDGALRIATEKVKWDLAYQDRAGIKAQAATDLPEGVAERMARVAKRVYRALGQTGYARMDFRLTSEGQIYLLESNPKPQLAYGEEFSEAANAIGIDYNDLIQRIVRLGLRYFQQLPQ